MQVGEQSVVSVVPPRCTDTSVVRRNGTTVALIPFFARQNAMICTFLSGKEY